MNTALTMRRVALGVILGLSVISAAGAAPGALDSAFGSGGKVATIIGSGNAYANAVAIQPDGKIVAAGYSADSNSHNVITVARYNADGTLDGGFDGNGEVTTSIGSIDDEGNALAVQPDGKIVVAGYSNLNNAYVNALVRYNADGTLDTTFNGTGKVTTAISTSDDRARALALQPDGKIVVAGQTNNANNNHDFALLRYNADGTLDTTFNGTGKVTTAIGNSEDVATAVVVQPDGKILAAGYSEDSGNNYEVALVRYNSDGSLDTTFNSNGMVTTAVGSFFSFGAALALQPDGKILVAGYYQSGSSTYGIVLLRYDTDGTPDTTFNGTGEVTTAVGGLLDFGHALAIQPDGRILVAGESYNAGHYDFAVVRYNSDGGLDTTFGGNGMVTTILGSAASSAYAVALQPDGKIVAAGNAQDNATHYNFALVRYLANDANNDGVAEPWGLTPAGFSFTDESGVALNTLQTSADITITGLETGVTVPVTVSGGEYAVGGGSYTTDIGYVSNGDQISVRHTSSTSYDTATNTVLTVGGLHAANNAGVILGTPTSDTFTSTTLVDTVPNAFSFPAQTAVPLSTTVTSNSITVSGIAAATPISVTGGDYAINGGAFTSANGTVNNGDTVVVRHTSASTPNTSVNTVLTIGGVSATFTSTTTATNNTTGTTTTTPSAPASGGGALGPPWLLALLGYRVLRRRG